MAICWINLECHFITSLLGWQLFLRRGCGHFFGQWWRSWMDGQNGTSLVMKQIWFQLWSLLLRWFPPHLHPGWLYAKPKSEIAISIILYEFLLSELLVTFLTSLRNWFVSLPLKHRNFLLKFLRSQLYE